MKKILLGSNLIIFMLVLVACGVLPEDTSLRLNAPRNIEISRNVLTFSEVEGASSYIININGDNTPVDDNVYTFTEDGTYRVRIQSISGLEDVSNSVFSDLQVFKVRFLQYPDDINVFNNQVFFTKDEDAQSYDVEIDGVVFNSDEDLPPYLEPGTYDIRVRAKSDIYNESDYSPMVSITVHKEDRLYTVHQYQYSVLSTFELPLYQYVRQGLSYYEVIETEMTKDEVVEMDMLKDRMDFYVAQNTLYFTTSYLKHLIEETIDSGAKTMTVSFIVKTNLGDHEIELVLHHLDTPYSFNGQTQSSNFKDDVIFLFDTFGFEFIDIKGHDITEDDYSFEDNILTVFADYVIEAYGMKRKSEALEFTVVFQKDETVYEYLIFIEK